MGKIETDYEGYSALGTLWSSNRTNIRLGPFTENDEHFIADAMGNVVHKDVARSGSGGAPSQDSTVSLYGLATGRLARQLSIGSVDTTLYTADLLRLRKLKGVAVSHPFRASSRAAHRDHRCG